MMIAAWATVDAVMADRPMTAATPTRTQRREVTFSDM
jgi:hypothetical protein